MKFRFIDFLIVVVFLPVAAYGIYEFRGDLLQTINLQKGRKARTSLETAVNAADGSAQAGEGSPWPVEDRRGREITSSDPVRTQTLPLLPAPQNMHPGRNYSVSVEELQYQKKIVFAWSQVYGANAYIFSLYYQYGGDIRHIISATLDNRTVYTLENLDILDSGTFLWQVEAVNRRGDMIEQRGRIGESVFILDLPVMGGVQAEEPGILYTNDEPRLLQRLTWSGGENALRYEVTLERDDGERFFDYEKRFTVELSQYFNLPPGNYRFRVIPYDVLERPGEGSDWIYFEVFPEPERRNDRRRIQRRILS